MILTITFDATTKLGVGSARYLGFEPVLAPNELECTADQFAAPGQWKLAADGKTIIAASAADLAPSVAQLIAYAEAKQAPVLAALKVSHALKDGSATLTTMCDDKSRVFLNSLAAWVLMNAAASPAPTRTYYNLDGSAVQVTPANMGEFLAAVGAAEQSTFDTVATVRTAITSSPATITTFAQVDAFAWPTTAS